LVVDDNTVNQMVAVRMLDRLGHRADVASNGLEAVEAVDRIHYAAVFMDCRMPVMDGYEATREIRRRRPKDRLPIIALTGNAMEDEGERILQAGMDDRLLKPVTLEALAAALRRWIEPAVPTAPAAPNSGTEQCQPS
jgi:CheY-like chemotaxis protein